MPIAVRRHAATIAGEVASGRQMPCKAMAIVGRRTLVPMVAKVEEAGRSPMVQVVPDSVVMVPDTSTSAEAVGSPCRTVAVQGLSHASTVGVGSQAARTGGFGLAEGLGNFALAPIGLAKAAVSV